jgi:hypothetical protein
MSTYNEEAAALAPAGTRPKIHLVTEADALTAWAGSDWRRRTAVAITLTSSVRRYFIDRAGETTLWVEWDPKHCSARPCWADLLGAGGQGSEERFLLALCQNIAHGPGKGPVLDLRSMGYLDQDNTTAVLAALSSNLTAAR